MRTARHERVALSLLAGLAVGCGGQAVSPQPLPVLGGDAVHAEDVSMVATPQGVLFRGAAGAVEPGYDHISGMNLDGVGPALEAQVEPDGAFEMELPGSTEDLYRFQPSSGETSAWPVDLTGGAAPPAAERVSPCLLLPPESVDGDFGDVVAGTSATLELELDNDCGLAVTIEDFRLRAQEPAFSIEHQDVPFGLPDGARTSVTVRFEPSQAGVVEDVLLIGFRGDVGARTAVTLRGRAHTQ